MKKVHGILLIFSILLLLPSVQVKAEQGRAVIDVSFIEYSVGGISYIETFSESLEGISGTLLLPNGEEAAIEDGLYIVADREVPEDAVGKYTLKEIEYPEGYELDTVLLEDEEHWNSNWGKLSLELTEEDREDWNEYLTWSEEQQWGDYRRSVLVPVKKTGELSPLEKPLPKPETEVSDENLFFQVSSSDKSFQERSVNGEDFHTEFEYKKKKDGKWKSLEENSDNMLRFQEQDKLQDGKSYYFRARFQKTFQGKTIYSEYCDPIKIKVRKSQLYQHTLKISVKKKDGKEILSIQGDGGRYSSYDIMLYYSEKKNGTYHFSTGSFVRKVELSKLPELKKGKTYYFKARLCEKNLAASSSGNEGLGKFSNVVSVKIR